MDKQVLDIIIENLTNERLDGIVRSVEEYRQAEEEMDKTISVLEGMLDKEQNKVLDRYLSAENHRAAVYAEISYKQGMKDLVSLVMALVDW